MTARAATRGRSTRWIVVASVLIAAAIAAAALAGERSGSPSRSSAHRFPRFGAGPAPAGWRSETLPGGNAVLAIPPGMHPVAGDNGSVSAAQFNLRARYLLYLNATPREGAETLKNWPQFRLHLLRADDASAAHEIAAAADVRFRGGTGSCVLDSYVTRIGAHHYEELACFVQGRASGSVIVAAASAHQWPAYAALLERAVAAYQVR